jgi:methylated-DNA-[protein]-cysteine S-methyltransferase
MNTIYWTNTDHLKKNYFIFSTDKGICWIGDSFEEGGKWLKKTFKDISLEQSNHSHLATAKQILVDYLSGKQPAINIPFDLYGTEFQKLVWNHLLKIPYGETLTYQQLATAINKPNTTRAVGAACGANPVLVLVPCHRVVGSKGALTGYAGGIATKQLLLDLEKS